LVLVRIAYLAQIAMLTFVIAPSMEPDADDTAKCIMALSLMGIDTTKQPLVEAFGRGKWFITYPHERNFNFSTNCNVLNAFQSSLDDKNSRTRYADHIEKTVRNLAGIWLRKPNQILDKWVRLCLLT
jgi:hypothetical protein